jgi:hypothetical protein
MVGRVLPSELPSGGVTLRIFGGDTLNSSRGSRRSTFRARERAFCGFLVMGL